MGKLSKIKKKAEKLDAESGTKSVNQASISKRLNVSSTKKTVFISLAGIMLLSFINLVFSFKSGKGFFSFMGLSPMNQFWATALVCYIVLKVTPKG